MKDAGLEPTTLDNEVFPLHWGESKFLQIMICKKIKSYVKILKTKAYIFFIPWNHLKYPWFYFMAFNGLLSEGYNLCSPNFLFTYLFSSWSSITDSAAPILLLELSLEKVKAAVICTFQIWNASSKIKKKTENKQKEPPLSLFRDKSICEGNTRNERGKGASRQVWPGFR